MDFVVLSNFELYNLEGFNHHVCKLCYGLNHHFPMMDLSVQCHESTVYIDMSTKRTFSTALSKNAIRQLQFRILGRV